MPQQAIVLDQTIESNIVMEQRFELGILQRATSIARIQDLPLHLELSEASPLSGGQLQRIGLARALYRHFLTGLPLVLDEPLSQLDPDLAHAISDSLAELAAKGSRIVVASHQEALVSLADREVKFG
jgi:ABC-type protease/lipase transport system fused ATPase/permease subunit